MELTKEEIKKIIPQRDPILLLDRVTELEAPHRIEAEYFVPQDLPVFAGHFPAAPVFPGVYSVEAMAQAADVLLLSRAGNEGMLPLFAGIEKARFLRKILPGQTLRITAALLDPSDGAMSSFRTACYDKDSGKLCASAVLILSPRAP